MAFLRDLVWGLRSHIAGYPRSDWEAAGITSATELDLWTRIRAASPSQVQAWRKVTSGFGEAQAWASRQINPAGASDWKQVASGLAEVDSWRRIGVTTTAAVSQWKAVCGGIEEVVFWQRLGVAPTRVTDYRSRGVQPDLRRSWRRLGIEGVEEIARWTERGFDPTGARPWVRARVTPEDAAPWHGVGMQERSSRRWRKAGIPAAEAAQWVVARLDPRRASSWKSAGYAVADAITWVEAGKRPRDADGWSAIGVRSATEASAWEKAVGTQTAAERWRGAGVSNPHEAREWADLFKSLDAARRWIEQELTPQEAFAWSQANLGDEWIAVGDLAVAAAWHRERFSPEEYRRWRGISEDPLIAARWRGAVGGVVEVAEAWKAARLHDPDAARSLISEKVTPTEFSEWRRLGAEDAHAVLSWRRRWEGDVGLASSWVDRLGELLAGAAEWFEFAAGDVELAARWRALGASTPADAELWRTAGFKLTDAELWTTVGVGLPESASRWRDAGYSPQGAREWLTEEVDTVDAALAMRTADVSPAGFAEWKKLGATEPAEVAAWSARWALPEATRWRQYGESLDDAWGWRSLTDGREELAERWRAIGPWSARDAVRLVDAINAPSLAAATNVFEEFLALGVAAPDVLAWVSEFSLRTAVGWARAGFKDITVARRWRGARFSAERAATWAAVVDDPEDAGKWARLTGDDVKVAAKWRTTGFVSADDAAPFIKQGLEPAQVAAWAAIGVTTPADVVRWHEDWQLAEATAWTRRLAMPIDSAWEWRQFTNSDLDEARSWVSSAIATPAAATAWIKHGFNVGDARTWSRAGFDVVAAHAWRQADFAIGEAQEWRKVLADLEKSPSPLRADEWRRSRITAAQAGQWIKAEVATPARARQIGTIGLSAADYAALRNEHSAAELPAVLRREAITHAGLTLEDDVPTMQLEGRDPSGLEIEIRRVTAAAARAGEARVKVRHGWRHLSPAAVRAVPEARYVRGGEKAALLRLLWSDPPSELDETLGSEGAWELTDDGAATVLRLRAREGGDEFLILNEVAGS